MPYKKRGVVARRSNAAARMLSCVGKRKNAAARKSNAAARMLSCVRRRSNVGVKSLNNGPVLPNY